MEQPNFHEGDHFRPRFATVTKKFPFPIELPLDDLEEILRPLQIIQENLLQLPNISVPWKPRACGTIPLQEPKYVGIRPLTAMEEEQSIPKLDLDACLALLLLNLRGVELSLKIDTICLVRALVCFDPTETAMKVRSITDAQNLVELIFCLNKNECFKSWFGAASHNATRLAIAIYGRVPLLPRSLFLNSADVDRELFGDQGTYQGKAVNTVGSMDCVGRDCFDTLMWGCLSHCNMGPLLGICPFQWDAVAVMASPENGTLHDWRQSTNPSVSQILQIFFEVAKAIQYIHSLGIVLDLDAGPIWIDSDNRAKILYSCFRPTNMCKGQLDYDGYSKNSSTLEADIHSFGLLFYRVLSDEFDNELTEEPEIPDDVWQLIRWCREEDLKERPTIDQVVQEMESWISLGQFTLSS